LAKDTRGSFKVVKFRIDKVTGQMQWREFTKLLRDVRYRVFRLANLVVSEKYLRFHIFRIGKAEEIKTQKISELSRQLRQMFLSTDKITDDEQNKFSKIGILPDTVIGGLTQYKVRGLTTGAKWKQVINGETSLPTFRKGYARSCL